MQLFEGGKIEKFQYLLGLSLRRGITLSVCLYCVEELCLQTAVSSMSIMESEHSLLQMQVFHFETLRGDDAQVELKTGCRLRLRQRFGALHKDVRSKHSLRADTQDRQNTPSAGQ